MCGALWVDYSSVWHPIRAAVRQPRPVLEADSLAGELLTGRIDGGGGGGEGAGAWCGLRVGGGGVSSHLPGSPPPCRWA